MYRLTNEYQTLLLRGRENAEALQAWTFANERLGDASQGLVFDPVPHRYSIGGTVIPSVSSIVEYFDPFDTPAVAYRCSKNERHEMYGKSVSDILEIWKARGLEAAAAGTVVHEFGEACFLAKAGRLAEVPQAYAPRIAPDGTMEASSPKEEAVARWWNDLDLQRYVLIAKEARVYNPELLYAGTFDVLLYDLYEHHYVLKDYKTNGDIHKWYGEKLRAPLSPIKANDVGKYTVQQNLYKIELENIGLKVGRMDLIWLRDDGSYQEISISDCGKLVAFAARQYKERKLAA